MEKLGKFFSFCPQFFRVFRAEGHTLNFRFKYEKVLGKKVSGTSLLYDETAALNWTILDNFYVRLENFLFLEENGKKQSEIFRILTK